MIQKSDDIIIKTLARILVPFIQIYALYVIMHGHHSPGGGFQGGVILAASLILLMITHGLKETQKRISDKAVALFSSLGVFIYAGIGVLCLILAGNFLDYSKLAILLRVDPAQARSLGILGIEIGVGLAVMAVMFSVFYDISRGEVSEKDEDK
ncbi:MAG: Na(+)/H(+) antiporter subunit B [Deltaproteobacteria bacterium]|nr:Na(+)/H(+) antiporter subunit B [Deltaproteobacteria bacterium]